MSAHDTHDVEPLSSTEQRGTFGDGAERQHATYKEAFGRRKLRQRWQQAAAALTTLLSLLLLLPGSSLCQSHQHHFPAINILCKGKR